ncbi:tripartite tricarboxylate transporter substrate binding protein [Microvirga sp. VF16]|uniref:tripartite tricarboxylate transporter substrate binding protein n=1 Tax=Microvirga sp. VF16 TaxID=2807101 RepID=UPI001FED76E0|nr:tripartite tricarboxylate transporter substrate binding protein [Microvirga sp. VF16]
MNIRSLLIGTIIAAMGVAPSVASEYPAKPIEMIVAFAPGGGTDVAARSIARFMQKHLGEGASIAVINKPGAGGEIGWTTLSQGKPDGYTIGMINPPAFNALAVEGKAKYTMDSFQPIGNVVLDPGILVVTKNSPYKTLTELVDASKAAPGTIVVGTSGAAGSSEHIGILSLNRSAGSAFKPAFFGSTAPVRQAILGGHIPAATMNLSEALPLVRSGDVRLLGVMAQERSQYLPDAPTFKEQGYDLVVMTSRGLAAPAGTPPAVVEKLQSALKAAMEDPEYVRTAKEAEIPLAYLDAKAYRALIDRITSELTETWKVTPWR